MPIANQLTNNTTYKLSPKIRLVMGLIIWIIGFVAAAIGTLLAEFIVSLDIINAPDLITAIVWFLISYITYFAGTRIGDEEWFKLLSLNFFVTWAFCTFGVILGQIVWVLIENEGVTVQLDAVLAFFTIALPLTIGPTATMSMGLRD